MSVPVDYHDTSACQILLRVDLRILRKRGVCVEKMNFRDNEGQSSPTPQVITKVAIQNC